MKNNLKKIIITFGWLFFVLFFYSGISYLIKGIINSFIFYIILSIIVCPLFHKLLNLLNISKKNKGFIIGGAVALCLLSTLKINLPDKKADTIVDVPETTIEVTTVPIATTSVGTTITTSEVAVTTITTIAETIPTITETEATTYSIDLNDIYNYVEEGMLYNDVLDYVKSTGLPYKELSYLRAWTIKIAYTSGATVDKHSEKGDYVVINFDLPEDISSGQNKNDYVLTSIRKFSQETSQSTEKEFTTTLPVITTILETETLQTFPPITEVPKIVVQTYVLNTSTGKVHKSTCRDVDKISSENYAECDDLQWAFDNGYEPCGHCYPH